MNYSIIIPYQHSPEREPLLYACLENLFRLHSGFEVCIHEIGVSQHFKHPSKCKYLFTKFSGPFHRAWAINRGVRELATGNMLVLMDGDLIVNSDWVRELVSCKSLSVGWGKLSTLNAEGTIHYLRTCHINKSLIEKTKTPSMGGAAGGITVIPSSLFYSIKGIPEDFSGSWGGEDNALWAKLNSVGYKVKKFSSEIFHLSHSPSTPRVKDIQHKIFQMIYWSPSQWTAYLESIGDSWGSANPDSVILPSHNFIASSNSCKLTLVMLSWLRYDKLLNTLKSHLETLTIPVNLTLMVQGEEKLTGPQKKTIRSIASKFNASDVYFSPSNIGTGPARKSLLSRSLKRFDTPYINFSDDDTTFSDGVIESAINFLNSNSDVGVVGIRYKSKLYRLNSHLSPTTFIIQDAKHPIEYVDSTGSASAIIRKEIFDICSIDPTYIIGEWDIDLFLQARSVGWKIANIQTSDKIGVLNDWGGSLEYRKARLNRSNIAKSVKYFKQKWGLVRAL